MHIRRYESTDSAALTELLERRAVADGRDPLSEHKAMRIGDAGALELIATVEGQLVAYAMAAHHDAGAGHWAVEIVIAPHRADASRMFGSLGDELRTRIPSHEIVTVWGWRPDDLAAAEDHHWPKVRRLLEMTTPLPVAANPAPMPAGVVLDVFHPGRDEEAWIAANAAAFAHHPENGSVDRANLEARMAQPWFDPKGFLLAWEDGRLLGSCWTKLHPECLGEIYIIGVIPAAQGRGLGVALLQAGLHDLADRQGATRGLLYVAGDDTRALELYRSMGFEVGFVMSEFSIPPKVAGRTRATQPKGWRQEGQ